MNKLVILLIIILPVLGCSQSVKINGLGFVSSNQKLTEKNIVPIININANFVALNPFAFMRGLDNTKVFFNSDKQWFGETESGIKQYAEEFSNKGIKIMLKPQIWVLNGQYTGFIKMKTEEDWLKLEKSYRTYILNYAKIASQIKADIFCIGVELEQFTVNRPKFWIQLIKDVKKVYSGQLTYAANWDEYKRVDFWGQLDFIGIDAYFPLSESKSPTVKELEIGWRKYKAEIKSISKKYNKRVLFTEYGYRSVNYTAKEPWDSSKKDNSINHQAQNNALQALHNEFWDESWFAGGFVWKWFLDYKNSGGASNNRFTPQNKPAELLLKKLYKTPS